MLNSKLATYYHRSRVGETGRVFAEVKLVDLGEIPIRRINFATSSDRRAIYLEDLRQLYALHLTALHEHDENDFQWALDFSNNRLSQRPEASDVVHDLLVFLAEEMLSLNKVRHVVQHEFVDWLADTLKIQPYPDKKGKIGIDSLKKKSELLNYWGDYQKGEKALEFEVIKDILQDKENTKRYTVSITERLLANVEGCYRQSLDKILPLKRQLEYTDKLIDKVVYCLYGLTEDEILVVEGPA